MSTRVRFAPSPTGQIHIGNIRTALFNYLFARKTRGTFILRIEDTDKERSTKEFEEIILKEMEWLGLDVDEGLLRGGEKGPYRQSQRLHLYQEYVKRLLQEERAYYCFCSKEEIQQMRQVALQREEMPRYDQRCGLLTHKEVKKLADMGRKPVVRFRLPAHQETLVVKDLIKGEVEFKSSILDDFVIQKSDGMPTYNFAVVIDDALMEITHVIRGEDHLSNTPKQILLYKALGFKEPSFAHLGMILDQDKKKLSKRSDDAYVFVSQYRSKGYLPQALINYLALLGWSPADDEEILSREELIQKFSLEGVSRSPAIFDLEKLNWLNGVYIRRLDEKDLAPLLATYFAPIGIVLDKAFIEDLALLMKDSLQHLSMITEEASFIFKRPKLDPQDFQDGAVQEALSILKNNLLALERWDLEGVKGVLKGSTKGLKIKGKALFFPLRLSLTGQERGPDLFKIIYLLGREESVNRLEGVLLRNI